MGIGKLVFGAVLLVAAALAGCSEERPVLETVEDAQHARIGVMTGSTGEAYAKHAFPDADIKSFDDIMDAVAAVKSGQIDGIVTAISTAIQVAKTNPEFRHLEERLTNENTAAALRKGNDKLLADVNRIISDLRNEGRLEEMKERWFKDDLSPYNEPDIQLPETGEPLRIGVAATREPVSFVDKGGRFTGYDGELARLFGQRLGRPVEFHDMKFMALIPALASGKIDMIVTGMTATDERRKAVDFTQSYFANAQVLMTRKPDRDGAGPIPGGGLELRSQDDLADKRIGVMMGTVYDGYAVEKWPKAEILNYQSSSDLALALATGKVDAILYDAEPLREILRERPDLTNFGPPLFTLPMGIGFRKGSPLLGEFNRFLAEIRSNGLYDDMTTRWIDHREFGMPQIRADAPMGKIVVGATGGSMPFSGVQDGVMIGFDIELTRRFAAFLGRDIEIADMEFGSLIAAVAAGKVDLIAASIYITEERKRQIDFSNPYFAMESWVAVRKIDVAGTDAPTAVPERSFLEGIADSFQSNIIHEKRYLLLWEGLKVTVLISIAATLFGTALGALICFMRMSHNTLLQIPAKIYISILRGMPVLVLLMLIYYVAFASVNISPILVAVIAFGMNFAAYTAEIYRSGIVGIDKGQSEAGIAMGFTRLQAFIYIVLPQTVRRILPVYKGEFISLVKMTSIVGYIAVQDLTKASDIIRSRTFDAFFPLVMVAILYFLISWLLMQSLGYLERKTDPQYGRRKAGAA
ncbi:ABC transporter substrate-binding protein/permease [Emcibacter sp. SYSU 3D8]|uniref:ABC transporter substrate-binding protein/permease n=1 Tax=Emcibacter sp. SYSU 3D8 TaxID=3133969 RepID=UPI0031FE6AF8